MKEIDLIKQSGIELSDKQHKEVVSLVKEIKKKHKDVKDQERVFKEEMQSLLDSRTDVEKVLTQMFKEVPTTQKVRVTNLPEVQEISGDVTVTNFDEIIIPDIDIDSLDVDILNKNTPTDYVTIRLTDGEKFLDPRQFMNRMMGGAIIEDYPKIIDLRALKFNYDPEYEPANVEGEVWWDATDHTLNIYTGLGNTLQVGQEQFGIGVNKTGALVESGKVVYFSGIQGLRPTFDYADARDGAKVSLVGVVTADAENNQECPITTFGLVRGFNTSIWGVGDKLFVDSNATGALTSTVPSNPNYRVWVATVVSSHITQGCLFVSPRIDFADGNTFDSLDINNNFTVGGSMKIGSEIVTQGSASPGNDLISGGLTCVDETKSVIDIQNLWDFTTDGGGLSGINSIVQTKVGNVNNMTGVLSGVTGRVEHMSDGVATEVSGVSGYAGAREGGDVLTAKGLTGGAFANEANTGTGYGLHVQNFVLFGVLDLSVSGAFLNPFNYGTINDNIGLLVDDMTSGNVSNINVLIGTTTVPAGDYSVYSASTKPSLFKGDLTVEGNTDLQELKAIGFEMQFDYNNPEYYSELSFDVSDDPDTKTIYDDNLKTTTLYTIDYDFTVTDIITKTITRESDSAVMTVVTDLTGATINKTVTIT